MPGAYFPGDFNKKNIKNEIIAMLKIGKIAVDWDVDTWDNFKELYFLRPKVKGVKSLFHHHKVSDNIPCIFWNDKSGCELKLNDRPSNCRFLEPKKEDGKYICIPHDGSKNSAIRSWKKYCDFFENIFQNGLE